MPLPRPIASIKEELRNLVVDDLPSALKKCRELLPENTDKYNTVLAMQANLKQLNSDRMRNIIDSEEYGRRLARISSGFLEFVSELEEPDFDPPQAAPKTSDKKTAKQGSVLYQVPHSMALAIPSICKIRVAIDEEAIFEDLIVNDDVRLKERVEVSERMSAELMDIEGNVFKIQPLNQKDQIILETGYTEWQFRVTPLTEGEHQLLVKVSLLAYDNNTKEYVPRDVSVLETVTVVTATSRGDEAEPPLKSAGESFVLGPAAAPSTIKDTINVESNSPNSLLRNPAMRATAFFLAFLIFVPSFTWAVTPPIQRDYWLASVQNTPQAYQEFIGDHENNAEGGVHHPLIEKAYFYKAEESNQLEDLREYQKYYDSTGVFHVKVMNKIETLAIQEVKRLEEAPSALNIKEYLIKFPEAYNMPKVIEAAKTLPAEQQSQLWTELEKTSSSKAATANPAALQSLQQALQPAARTTTTTSTAVEKATTEKSAVKETPSTTTATTTVTPTTQKTPTPAPTTKTPRPTTDKTPQQQTQNTDAAADKAAKDQAQRDAAEKSRAQAAAAEKERLAEEERRAQAAAAEKERQAQLELEKRRQTSTAPAQEADFTETFNKLNLKMVNVPGGSFQMGSNNGEDDEKPVHQVTVSSFSIGKYEVTQAQWRAVMGKDPEELSFKGCDQCPVESVSWEDIQEFLTKLNAKTGKKYRLPTEAEWEFAARGGNKKEGFEYAGSSTLKDVAWYGDNSDSKTHPVGSKKPNALGIYDMSGNVYEWCQDWFSDYSSASQTNPKGAAKGSYRVNRGGSWFNPARYCRVSFRNCNSPANRRNLLGFRLAL